MKFKEERPFAEQKLLELANAVEADHAGRLSVAVVNKQFREAGGSYEEYAVSVKAAIAHGWITIKSIGTPQAGLYILALLPRRDPRATSMIKLALAAFLLFDRYPVRNKSSGLGREAGKAWGLRQT